MGGGGGGGGGGGLLIIMPYKGKLHPTFSRVQVYESVGISLVEVYERVAKSVISGCNDLKGLQKDFMAKKKSKKCLVCDLFIFKGKCIYSS